jgi:hypothetical protein
VELPHHQHDMLQMPALSYARAAAYTATRVLFDDMRGITDCSCLGEVVWW